MQDCKSAAEDEARAGWCHTAQRIKKACLMRLL